jgi:hypothetical protein
MSPAKAAFDDAHVERVTYRLWVADPTGSRHIPAGYDGCQWLWKALGRNLDESLFAQDAIKKPTSPPKRVYSARLEIDLASGHWSIRRWPRGASRQPRTG